MIMGNLNGYEMLRDLDKRYFNVASFLYFEAQSEEFILFLGCIFHHTHWGIAKTALLYIYNEVVPKLYWKSSAKSIMNQTSYTAKRQEPKELYKILVVWQRLFKQFAAVCNQAVATREKTRKCVLSRLGIQVYNCGSCRWKVAVTFDAKKWSLIWKANRKN